MSGYLNYFQAYSDRYSSNFYKKRLRDKKETPPSGVSFDDECDRYSSNFFKRRLRVKRNPTPWDFFLLVGRSLQQQFLQAWLES
jgi:hypothetical protein